MGVGMGISAGVAAGACWGAPQPSAKTDGGHEEMAGEDAATNEPDAISADTAFIGIDGRGRACIARASGMHPPWPTPESARRGGAVGDFS